MTVAVVTLVIMTYFSKTTWHIENRWDVLRAAFCKSCELLLEGPFRCFFIWCIFVCIFFTYFSIHWIHFTYFCIHLMNYLKHFSTLLNMFADIWIYFLSSVLKKSILVYFSSTGLLACVVYKLQCPFVCVYVSSPLRDVQVLEYFFRKGQFINC